MLFIVCFFKQKTAYDMRISDWSSDVCSSDLAQTASSQAAGQFVDQLADRAFAILRDKSLGRDEARRQFRAMLKQHVAVKQVGDRLIRSHRSQVTRSEERRVGQECVST